MGFLSRSLTITNIQAPGLPAFRARGSAKTSAHQCSVVASCVVDHGRAATTFRARSIASIRIAISGRLGSSRVKFGAGLVTTALRPCNNQGECTCSPTVTTYRQVRIAWAYAAFSALLCSSANSRNSGASPATRSGWHCCIFRR
jgi:hypothetical protein